METLCAPPAVWTIHGNGPRPEAPFEGLKRSGFSREGALDDPLEFSESQIIARA